MGTRSTAALRTALWFVVAPGTVAGVVPWLISRWEPTSSTSTPLTVLGVTLVAAGSAVVLETVARFVIEGLGTPAPVAPTQRLVIGGLYRYVRNPMYLAVLAVILGQAAILARLELVIYGVIVTLAEALFVRAYEEPALRRTFGEEYDAYRLSVPGWLPQAHAWHTKTRHL